MKASLPAGPISFLVPTSAGELEADFSQGNDLHLKSEPPRGCSHLRSICRAERCAPVPGVTSPPAPRLPCHTFTASAATQAPLPPSISVPGRCSRTSGTGWLVALASSIPVRHTTLEHGASHPHHRPCRQRVTCLPGHSLSISSFTSNH